MFYFYFENGQCVWNTHGSMSENLWKNLFFQKLERMELGVQKYTRLFWVKEQIEHLCSIFISTNDLCVQGTHGTFEEKNKNHLHRFLC